jgi:hypothetical protein
MTLDAAAMLGTHDVLLMTFDTLRYDVAASAQTPNLRRLLPGGQWERRHTPGSFTYAAHHAFFAGFLPTPTTPGPHPRLLATRFAGSESVTLRTLVFDAPDLVTGFAAAGYHTLCIGGVGFFNKLTPLSNVLPRLFVESHWSEQLGVTAVDSAANQFALAAERLAAIDGRAFTFINLSAMHQPNCHHLPGETTDSPRTQAAALESVDRALPTLLTALDGRGPTLCIFCSDHGTCYGEGGHVGHRLAHEVVWDVPYAEFVYGCDS